jgi:hypothetical protein
MTDELKEDLVSEPPIKDRSAFWLEATSRFALPLVTAIVALAGTYLTTTINEQNNLRDTINQREQAESALRTSMFRELVSPLVTDNGMAGDVNRSQRLALLAELLALNFHEHFELGPLMLYVDELSDQTTVTRTRLRSIARRVISRQLAVLGPPAAGQKGEQCADERTDVDIWLMSDASEPPNELQTCELLPPSDGKSAYFMCSRINGQPESGTLTPFTVSSLDCQDQLTILLADLNWASNTVRILATSTPDADAAGAAQSYDPTIPEFVEFTLSPYAMPFSDNTLLRSGNRFGIYLRQIEPSRDPCTPPVCDPTTRLMRLSLIWFPRDFIPPRERPTDFEEIRNALKL